MKRKQFHTYSIVTQVVLWFIHLSIGLVFDASIVGIWPAFVFSVNYTVMLAIIVYFHYFKLLPLLVNKEYIKYSLYTVALLTSAGIAYTLLDNLIPYDYPITHGFLESYAYNFLSLVMAIIISSMFYFVKHWHTNKEKEELLKTEKLKTELNFLRSQINPHFLFNTLNNIYSYAQTGNEKTAPMLEKLSGILRFMVYDGNNSLVELNKEIEAIENLLEIYRMKNSDQRNIKFRHTGNKGYHLVAPLILINLVENACKHSNTISNTNGYITVEANVKTNDKLYFSISNSVKKNINSSKVEHSGFGLNNMVKRLHLLYGTSYTMKETNDGNSYNIQLEIPLERKT